MSNDRRTSIGALVLSVAAIAGIAGFEGYRGDAYVPVPGDKVTVGHGTTQYPNGGPIRLGDKVTPQRAMELLQHDVSRFGRAVLKCTPVPMHQYEYDAFVSLAYNIGIGKSGVANGFCYSKRGGLSTIAKRLNAFDYAGACKGILAWDKFKGKPLRGLTNRRQAEYKMCMGEK